MKQSDGIVRVETVEQRRVRVLEEELLHVLGRERAVVFLHVAIAERATVRVRQGRVECPLARQLSGPGMLAYRHVRAGRHVRARADAERAYCEYRAKGNEGAPRCDCHRREVRGRRRRDRAREGHEGRLV
ncbi:MAG: hypothetical protein H5U40_04630, partial [Polyangiaceae bacterium]|nr:hypothetical protein [Polyangiaceae bacterium]